MDRWNDALALPAEEIVACYRSGALSPVDVTRATLERIERLQPLCNPFVVVTADEAMAAARASEARWRRGAPQGLVDGLPTTVKDLLLMRGWPTRRGSLSTPETPADDDSAAVARLREAGAVFVGKTTTSEFGWKGVTDSPLTGTTANPWNASRAAGGSSGGAAVAAANGLGVLHLATDGGGSIRIPAGFCGLFGFKPTFGLVPVHPHPPAWTLWHQGPIARNVRDAALLLTVIAGPEPRDFYAAPPLGIDFRERLDDGIAGLRIGYSRTLGYARVDPEVADAVDRAVRRFAELGAHVEEVDPALDDPIDIMEPLWSVALAMTVESIPSAKRALLDPPVLEMAAAGARTSALEYRAVEKRREDLARRMSLLHRRHDLLVTPQLATTAFAAGHEVPPGSGMARWWEWSPFTYPFNLTQQPAATLPCGVSAEGLPIAMQLIGARFDDARVLRAGRAWERLQPFRLPPTPAGPS